MTGKPAEKPRVKTWKPKVRTGCRTCRARHLKCDETRPACLRCVKMGFECDGYPKSKPAPIEPRGLVPRNFKTLIPKAISGSPLPGRTLSTYHFENQQEYLSFQIFHERSMFELVGSGISDLWDRIVLQACEYQSSIRNAVIAIGALDCTSDTSRAGDEPDIFGSVGGIQRNADRYHFALQKYGCAIGEMRRDIGNGQYDLRTTLICCILVVCFQLFEGNHRSALNHATSGLALFNERKNGPKENGNPGQMENFEEGLGDIFKKLDRTGRPFALKSLFEVQEKIKGDQENALPEVFTSCTEARKGWNRTLESISRSMGLSQNRAFNSRDGPRTRVTSSTTNISSQELQGEETDLAFARVDQYHYYPQRELDQLLNWYTSFQPLFNKSRISNDTSLRTEAAFLQGHHHINLIALTCAQWDDELQYDNYTPLFREILELSQDILIEQKSPTWHRPVFTFDTGVIGFLWIVATKCRDSATRWKAVQLMLDSPSREGRWHSAFVAKGAETIIRMEELGMEGIHIPEQARVRAESVTFELVSRKGMLTYSRLPRPEEFGRMDRIYEKIEVPW